MQDALAPERPRARYLVGDAEVHQRMIDHLLTKIRQIGKDRPNSLSTERAIERIRAVVR
jgi:hypothetical protein